MINTKGWGPEGRGGRAAGGTLGVSGWAGLRGGGLAGRSGSGSRGAGPGPGGEGRGPGGRLRGPPRPAPPDRQWWAAAARTHPRAGPRPSHAVRSGCGRAAHTGRTCAARRTPPAAPPPLSTRCRHRSMWRPLAGGSRYGSSAVVTSQAAGYLHYRVRRIASRCDTPVVVITVARPGRAAPGERRCRWRARRGRYPLPHDEPGTPPPRLRPACAP